MQTILVANPKGGSGKTTLATNIAGWLAGKRQRVGLLDADPQGSATAVARAAARPVSADRRIHRRRRQERDEGRRYRVAGRRQRRGDARRRAARSRAASGRDGRARFAVHLRHGRHRALPGRDRRVQGGPRRARRGTGGDARRCAHARRRRARRVPEAVRRSRSSRTCATRRCMCTARATGIRCSICPARAASRTGSSGSR